MRIVEAPVEELKAKYPIPAITYVGNLGPIPMSAFPGRKKKEN